jgi:hypothetical protein
MIALILHFENFVTFKIQNSQNAIQLVPFLPGLERSGY